MHEEPQINLLRHENEGPEPGLSHIYSTSHLKQSLLRKHPRSRRNNWDLKRIFSSLCVFWLTVQAPFLTKHLIPQCCVVILTLRLPRKSICLNSWKMHVEYKTGITLRRQVNEFDLQRTNSSRTHSCFQFSPLGILFIHLCSPTPCFFPQNEVDLHNERGSNLMYGGRRVP